MKQILLSIALLFAAGCTDSQAQDAQHPHNECCECTKLSEPVKSPVYGACTDAKHPLMQGNFYETKAGTKVFYTLCRGLVHTCAEPTAR